MNRGIIAKIIFFSLTVMTIFACTKKKNSTGVPDSNIVPHECTISSEHLERFYSYEDSIRNANITKLVFGNYNNIKSVSLLKFLDMPDSAGYVENAKLTFYIKEKLNFENINNIKIGKINEQKWYENYVTWFETSDSTGWSSENGFSENDYENIEITDIISEEDTISIIFPNDIVENWIEADSTNFGIAFYTEQDSSFIEFYSTEAVNYPILEFDYLDIKGDTLAHYVSANSSAYDAFIYNKIVDNGFDFFANELKINNIFPTKMFIKFNISDTLFTDSSSTGISFNSDETGINNLEEYRRMRINKANLILYRKGENFYPLGGNYGFKPYLVINEEVDQPAPDYPFEYSTDYISYESTSSDTLLFQEISIDITDIVQTIVSGSYDNLGETYTYINHGIIIKSIYENCDHFYVEFYIDEAASDDYKPKLEIIYTPPYLD